jgi:saccharopine dehydrogenase (NADP+, L-glutamate forming)
MQFKKEILVLGAGRSSSSLISYLLTNSEKYLWKIKVADSSLSLAVKKIGGHSRGEAIVFDVNNEAQRKQEIKKSDLVISLMPPPFHYIVAQTCIEFSKSLLTASYVSPEIATLHEQAIKKDIIILMETGLDPGIDHMSSIKEIEHLVSNGGKLKSYKSFTGGLIAPESDNNPWHYKITWNPRNVVLAGQGVSKFLENGTFKEVNYKDLFRQIEKIYVEGYGEFEGYPNRDSLKYLENYKLNDLHTFLRGTLRKPGFCSSWNVLVQLGITDDSYKILDSEKITYNNLIRRLLSINNEVSIEEKLGEIANKNEIENIKWLGLLDDKVIGLTNSSPADILQFVLEEKLKLDKGDIDMIVMQHQFEFEQNGVDEILVSSLVVKGDDEIYTAMAKTVGLPLGIAAKVILEGNINLRGVQMPLTKEIYQPVLSELETMGIKFINEVRNL